MDSLKEVLEAAEKLHFAPNGGSTDTLVGAALDEGLVTFYAEENGKTRLEITPDGVKTLDFLYLVEAKNDPNLTYATKKGVVGRLVEKTLVSVNKEDPDDPVLLITRQGHKLLDEFSE
ncbi:hypothetical protein FIC87_12430 [Eggerthella lenta]|uniref:Uncharacterized protein n=1 Tax=Eggerthella lenta TaxID=84112 RepID=A0A5C5BRD1_EGGLN|nr:hypothetical protein [Eggerthella lenta]TNU89000.1 hypothetical protein FIC87_12430 [Eggerthella lenta]